MRFISTKNHSDNVSFETAVRQGLPHDNGLFMPQTIPLLPSSFFQRLPRLTLSEIGYEVLFPYVEDSMANHDLEKIVQEAFAFDIPLVSLTNRAFALELFHGPTLAFKDIGARFMARVLGHFNKGSNRRITVLVATSGDTGSAVANGFLDVENVNVVILYPKGKVSEFQLRQMATLGRNIFTLEVDGTFDDCQKMVKQAFLDQPFAKSLGLTSANSINVARLLPQMVYYFYAMGQLDNPADNVVFSVPSGNFGNLTAGLLAWKMGLPIKQFIASTNINDIVPQFLSTGKYRPRPSSATISNAMDVGDPSNFHRMEHLFSNDLSAFRSMLWGCRFTDDQTREVMASVFNTLNYQLDPHGAVAYLGLKKYLQANDALGILLETAHPVKFNEVVEGVTGVTIKYPDYLLPIFNKKVKTHPCGSEYFEFKEVITSLF